MLLLLLRSRRSSKRIVNLHSSESRKSKDFESDADADIASIFKNYLTKKWFPRDEKLTIECIVPVTLKRLDENDSQTMREIFEFLVTIKK